MVYNPVQLCRVPSPFIFTGSPSLLRFQQYRPTPLPIRLIIQLRLKLILYHCNRSVITLRPLQLLIHKTLDMLIGDILPHLQFPHPTSLTCPIDISTRPEIASIPDGSTSRRTADTRALSATRRLDRAREDVVEVVGCGC
jgi:hypothetical protein